MKHTPPAGIPPLSEQAHSISDIRRMDSFAGVYFAFNSDGSCHYVGESLDVTKRVSRNRPELAGRRISFIRCRAHDRKRIECYYIGLLDPPGNAQSTVRSKQSQPTPEEFADTTFTLAAEWLPVFRHFYPTATLGGQTVLAAEVGWCLNEGEPAVTEKVWFTPDLVCDGRSLESISDRRVLVSVIPWADVENLSDLALKKIRAATIAGYSWTSLILIGRPQKYFGVFVNERHKGCPRGWTCDEFLHPSKRWDGEWYPDEGDDLYDPREPYNNRHSRWRLAVREWRRDGEITNHIYCKTSGGAPYGI